MSCPAITNKGGKLSISRFPVPCELTLPELALLDYAVVPGVGSIGDTGIEQEISSYSTVNAGISPQSKAAAVGKAWDVEMIESQSAARDVFETASAVANKDTYATRIEWPDGAVEFSIVQVSSPTYVKGAPSGVRIVRYTMIPSFIPIVTSSLPVASNVAIGGIPFIGATLTATYSYYSPLGLPESGTEYQWYADGVAIPGATSTLLLITGDHTGSLITFGVTPSDGLSYGHEAISVSVGPVADSARFTADAPGLYTDTALTVPVTSYGDAVAGWRGDGLIGVQPTLTARPAYGRMPESGVRNRLPRNIMAGAVAGTPGTLPTGFSQVGLGSLVREVVGTGVDGGGVEYLRIRLSGTTSTTSYTLFWCGATDIDALDGQDWCWSSFLGMPAGSVSNISNIDMRAYGRTSAGSYVSVRAGTDVKGALTGTLTRFTESASLPGGPTVAKIQPMLYLEFSSGAAIDITLDIGLPQIEHNSVTDVQRVTARYDVTESGVPDTPILYYDLGDDVLPSAMDLPAVTGGTLVIAGEKGIWVEDSFNHAGGSWSLGPTTYTGGPAGLLPSLIGNRALGFAVFANSLTPEQLQVEVAYWMAKGAPGVWEGSGSDLGTYTLNTDPYP